jgi:hypothetical protein
MEQQIERPRFWAYVLVALAGLLLGMAMGQLGAVRVPGRSRVDWPAPAPTPPHPRSLQP